MKAFVYGGPGLKGLEDCPTSAKLDRILDAYETFANAASARALKVIIEA